MSSLQNWSSVIHKVETANLQQDQLQKHITRSNKKAYKQQLDREVQFKHQQNYIKSAQKQRELQEARTLAGAEKRAKLLQKQQHTKLHRQYENQNNSLLHLQQNMKSTTKQFDNQNLKNFLQHPFVKLVQNQDARMKNLKQKFIKQNQINHIQQEIKYREKSEHRYQEWQQKNNFIDHVQQTHAKRSQERQRFKNKYLRIKKPQDPSNRFAYSPETVQKTYIQYLNDQISQNNQRRLQQRQQIIDPKINPFYSSNKLEPDSSPAFLGRNPLSHERKRQLYFINKHLNTHHQRSNTAAIDKQSQKRGDKKDQTRRSSDYVKLAKRLNPEDNYAFMSNQKKPIYHPFRNQQNQSETIHLRSHVLSNRQKIQTETKQRKTDHSKEIHDNNSFRTDQSQNLQSNKRIKSQFAGQSFVIDSKLPEIHKKLYEPTSNSVRVNIPSALNDRVQNLKRPNRREFFRYDPITGKQAAVYV